MVTGVNGLETHNFGPLALGVRLEVVLSLRWISRGETLRLIVLRRFVRVQKFEVDEAATCGWMMSLEPLARGDGGISVRGRA